MERKRTKIFIRPDVELELINVDYPEDRDYYELIKEQEELGFNQLRITAEMMIEIMVEYFLEREYDVESIDSEEQYQEDVSEEVRQLNESRKYFSTLLVLLSGIKGDDSLTLASVKLSKGTDYIHIYSNGVLELNVFSYDREYDTVSEIIETILNKGN